VLKNVVVTGFRVHNSGKEPTQLGTGPDAKTCKSKTSDITYD
jgi:pectate lyase